MLILFLFLRQHQTGAALREELKDTEPDYTDMLKCDDCGAEFAELTKHDDKELGKIEVCVGCLWNIKEVENEM